MMASSNDKESPDRKMTLHRIGKLMPVEPRQTTSCRDMGTKLLGPVTMSWYLTLKAKYHQPRTLSSGLLRVGSNAIPVLLKHQIRKCSHFTTLMTLMVQHLHHYKAECQI